MKYLGIDYGARSDLEQLANPERVKITGQSYSTAVILLATGPHILSIEFATKFKINETDLIYSSIKIMIELWEMEVEADSIREENRCN